MLVSAVELVVTAALVGWMVVAGFFRKPGRVLSWPMFSIGRFTLVSLTGTRNSHTERINVYDFVFPGNFVIPPKELQLVIDFLADRYHTIEGTGLVLAPRGVWKIHVRDGRVVF